MSYMLSALSKLSDTVLSPIKNEGKGPKKSPDFEARTMIEKSIYRLGDYQISEYGDGVHWWHAHHGLGQQRNGRCFITGDILVIGKFSHEESGFLKREFLDRLKKLPIWEKTKFYCFASELFDVSSSRSLDKELSGHIPSIGSVNRSRTQAAKDEAPGVYRLDKYKVTVSGNSRISWQALEGRDRVVGGQCMIKSGILFIGSKEFETGGRSRSEFVKERNEATPWKRTGIWGHSFALRPCKSPPQTRQLNAMGQRDTWRGHKYRGNTVSTFWKGKQKTLKSLWPPGIKFKIPSSLRRHLPSSRKFHKPPWSPHGQRKVGLVLLIPLLLAGLLFGLILVLHSVEETSHRHHSSEEHHHR